MPSLALLWAGSVASAATICSSGCDFSTLREAIAAVPAGEAEVFTVSAGAYAEPGSVRVSDGRAVEFVASGPVTVSNGGNGPVFVADGAGSRLTVRGMSITAFNARAVEASHGAHVLLDDDVLYTIGLQGQGGAVLVDGASLDATATLFLDNIATSGGGHVSATAGATLTLTDCTFTGGFARRGGGLLLTGAEGTPTRATVVRGRFDDNLASEIGGAIAVTGPVELQIEGTVFEGNAAEVGGALGDFDAAAATVAVRRAVLAENRADLGGGAIASESATWAVEDSSFEWNYAPNGGALWIAGGSASMVRNLLCSNSADRGGAVWSRTAAPQVWSNNRLIENAAGVGGAVDHGGGALTLRHANLLGNRADVGGAVYSVSQIDLRNSLVAFTEGATAVVGSPVVAGWNAFWANVAGNLSGEAGTGVGLDVFDDPRLERYQRGFACEANDDFYSWYGPLRDAADALSRDHDGSPGDLGAYGGGAAPTGPWLGDVDGDGYPPLYDCVEGDPDVHPEAVDPPYDGLDQDCDRRDDFDRDGDGYPVDIDCDDNDPRVNPGARDRPGEDRDCDEGIDVDGDGYGPPLDCDDEDPRIHPGAVEDLDPTVDLDCVPPADVMRPLEPRTCGGGGLPPAWLGLGLAGLLRRRR